MAKPDTGELHVISDAGEFAPAGSNNDSSVSMGDSASLDYRGKWADMHALARAWRLSDTDDTESFRRYVMKISKGVTQILASPPLGYGMTGSLPQPTFKLYP